MGEQRMYVIFVDTTSANGLFEQGLNAILVSRSTLLNSKLNTSIFNFNPSSPGEMEDFKGANFYAYDIMSLVAQQGFEMSDTGALPKTLAGAIWEGLTGLVAGVADVLYQGLVAIGNFFASLGDAVASWGQKLLGAINAVADAVKGAVQAVLDALNAFVQWLIEMVQLLLQPFFNSIKNIVETWKNEITDATMMLYDDALEHHGMVSQANTSNFGMVIFNNLILPVMIISLLLGVLEIILHPYSPLGMAFLMGVVIATILSITPTPPMPPPINIGSIVLSGDIVQVFKNFLSDNAIAFSHTRSGNRGSRQFYTTVDFIILVISLIASSGSLFGATVINHEWDSPCAWGGFTFAFVAIMLYYVAQAAGPGTRVYTSFTIVMTAISFFGAVLGLVDIIVNGLHAKYLGAFGGCIGLLLGAIGIWLGAQLLEWI